MSKKNNRKRQTVPANRVVIVDGDPKMSEVILESADPLLDGDVSNAKEVDFIVQLAIAAWNKAMFPADGQNALEKQIIDTLVPPHGRAELVGRSSKRWKSLTTDERDCFRISAGLW